MSYIATEWMKYFEHRHEGLGTTYERFVLHRYFEKIKENYAIRTLIEAPSFGMTGISGINSLWWALNDCQVTVVDHDQQRLQFVQDVWRELSLEAQFEYQANGYGTLPFPDDSFDLGWNFAALSSLANPEAFLSELARICRSVIFICIPNRSNPFNILRRTLANKSNNLSIANNNHHKIKHIMRELHWQLDDEGYLDVPPWPDIAMNKEDLIKKSGLSFILRKSKSEDNQRICILDYYSRKNENMQHDVLKFGWFEDSPLLLKKFWAHHQYMIFKPVVHE